jgi:hypothetical protein
MKNREKLTLWNFLNFGKVLEKASEIKSTRLQWFLPQNYEKLQSGVKTVSAALEKLKSKELIEASKDLKSEKFQQLAKEFEEKPEVIELLDLDDEDFKLKKIKLSDLPADLDRQHFAAVEWMIEKEE